QSVMDKIISQIIHELFELDAEVVLSRPDEQFGDWATNVALQLAKPLGKNPREIAEQIAEKLRETGEYAEVSVAGPGFINIKLSDAALLACVGADPVKTLEDKTIVIEY